MAESAAGDADLTINMCTLFCGHPTPLVVHARHVECVAVCCCAQLLATSAAGDTAQHEVVSLAQQLDDLQTALEAAEMDRQALAAQRDGWMASFQVRLGQASAILKPLLITVSDIKHKGR